MRCSACSGKHEDYVSREGHLEYNAATGGTELVPHLPKGTFAVEVEVRRTVNHIPFGRAWFTATLRWYEGRVRCSTNTRTLSTVWDLLQAIATGVS